MANNIQLSIKIGVLFSMLLGGTYFSHAQQQKPEKVQVFMDTSAVTELFPEVQVGFAFHFPDKSIRTTRGLLGGKIPWKKVKVQSPQGELDQGRLHFLPEKVWHNNHRLDLTVTFADTTFHCQLLLPYLQALHFNLYTDSLKRNVPFYLNVEGRFSSGKIYPLDTEQVRFHTSGGQLHRNIVEVRPTDTIAALKIYAYFKWDDRIADSTLVPVKTHIAPVHLPTENELMEQWKDERRSNRHRRSH